MYYFRPTRAEIKLDNLLYNYRNIKQRVGKDVAVMGVVKANAYGHGAVMCARELAEAGSEYLGVASVDEALQLRKAGVTTPILVFGFASPEQLEDLAPFNLTYTAFNIDFIRALSLAGKKSRLVQKIHIKCDTGMGRLGFKGADEVSDAVKIAVELPFIEVEGLFSHFAESDALDKTYAGYQYANFMEVLSELEKADIRLKYRHIANSAAVIDMPETCFNMVRPGISLYGMYPSDDVRKESLDIKLVMDLKTEVIHMHKLKKGESLGYGRTFVASRDTMVATLPVGYGDGYKRILSNNNYVLINGCRAEVIGRICMDQCMVDVTDVKDVKLGEEVLLFGNRLHPAILADRAGTIQYEITTSIAPRVPRVFYKNGRVIDTLNALLNNL